MKLHDSNTPDVDGNIRDESGHVIDTVDASLERWYASLTVDSDSAVLAHEQYWRGI